MGASTRFKTIAAHYEGDTSRYEGGHHEHYAGNGMLRHPGGVFTDWKASGWVRGDNHFRMDSGVVTINEDGLYFVYAQVNHRRTNKSNRIYNHFPYFSYTDILSRRSRYQQLHSRTQFAAIISMHNGHTYHRSSGEVEHLLHRRHCASIPGRRYFRT